MQRRRIPTIAWVLSGGTALGLGVAAVGLLLTRGRGNFYSEGDAARYLLIASDLFGRGRAFTFHTEAQYRYGRVGFPFVAWLFAGGRPAGVALTLIGVNIAAIAAIPGLAATLLDEHGKPAAAGAIVLVPVGLYTLYRDPVADPMMIALILLAYVFDGRGRRTAGIVTLACAVLVKEVAALALVPWAWRALRARDGRAIGDLACALVPYTAWCLWLQLRLGSLPFLAHTMQRSRAFGLPLAGVRTTWVDRPDGYAGVLMLTVVTGVGSLAIAWLARRTPVAGLAAVFGALAICLGPNALAFTFEIGRLLAPAQVFALLALVFLWCDRRARGAFGSSASTQPLAR